MIFPAVLARNSEHDYIIFKEGRERFDEASVREEVPYFGIPG